MNNGIEVIKSVLILKGKGQGDLVKEEYVRVTEEIKGHTIDIFIRVIQIHMYLFFSLLEEKSSHNYRKIYYP